MKFEKEKLLRYHKQKLVKTSYFKNIMIDHVAIPILIDVN